MLNIDPVVKINVEVGAVTVTDGVFDIGAIIGPTSVTGKLDSTHRFKAYENIAAMVTDGFATTDPEYLAAQKYFGVSPAPNRVVIIHYDATSESDSPVIALVDAIDKGAEFYGVYYIPKASETAANIKLYIAGIASALESIQRGVVFYGVADTVANAIASGGLFDAMGGTKRACGLYCTSSADDAAGLMGAAMGLSRTNQNSVFALCYKTVASATENAISQQEVESIKAMNANVYVRRTRARAYVENGSVGSGLRFDDVLYLDRITYDIQQSIYTMIADSPVKLPQEDSTSLAFLAEIGGILDSYYTMGVLAENAWRGPAIGGIEVGDILEHGHAEFAESFDTQSVADRAAHKAMPVTVLLSLSGSVESIEITVYVQT